MPKKLKFSYLNHISMTEKVAETVQKNEKQNFKLKKKNQTVQSTEICQISSGFLFSQGTRGREGVSLSAVTCNMTRSFRIPEYWAGNSHWQPTETRTWHEKTTGHAPHTVCYCVRLAVVLAGYLTYRIVSYGSLPNPVRPGRRLWTCTMGLGSRRGPPQATATGDGVSDD